MAIEELVNVSRSKEPRSFPEGKSSEVGAAIGAWMPEP